MMIIAIDGPAASGKGTLARNLAERLGLPHLDTGLLYRAVGRRLLDQGGISTMPSRPGPSRVRFRSTGWSMSGCAAARPERPPRRWR